jgi:hypothetical protein
MADTTEVKEIELSPEFEKLKDFLQRAFYDQRNRWYGVRDQVERQLDWEKDKDKTYPGDLNMKQVEGSVRMVALIEPINEVTRMVNWVLKGYAAGGEAEVVPQLRELVLEKLTTINTTGPDAFQNLVSGIQLDFYREVSKILQKIRVR